MPEALSVLVQPAPLPLSTRYTAPWMAAASSLARNVITVATSCGCIMPRGARRVDKIPALCDLVAELLAQRWSPQQIARHLRGKYPDDPLMWLCHESIYQAVYQLHSRLIRPPQVESLDSGPLRMGRTHRHAHQPPGRRGPRFAQPMLSIHQRPFAPADRSQAGNWESQCCCQAASAVLAG